MEGTGKKRAPSMNVLGVTACTRIRLWARVRLQRTHMPPLTMGARTSSNSTSITIFYCNRVGVCSDIAFAVWQFWSSSRDNSGGWLNSTAWPLLSGIATFWMSKLAVDNPGAPAGSPLSLKHVMGPDEDHDPVDNSAFTNAGAILSLRRAADVARLLGMPSGVYAAWEDAAARVVIPYDAALKYHPEYDGYQPGTLVKQADTILLGFPLEIDFNMTPEVRFNDLTMYGGNVTDEGGPAMTWGMVGGDIH